MILQKVGSNKRSEIAWPVIYDYFSKNRTSWAPKGTWLSFGPVDISWQPICSYIQRCWCFWSHCNYNLAWTNHSLFMSRRARNIGSLHHLFLWIHQIQNLCFGIVIHSGDSTFVFDDIKFTSVIGGFDNLSVDFRASWEKKLGSRTYWKKKQKYLRCIIGRIKLFQLKST